MTAIDDDDDDDDDELFLWYGWLTKGVSPYFQSGPLSEILTIASLQAGFEPAQNLSSGLVEWSCAVVITTTFDDDKLPLEDLINATNIPISTSKKTLAGSSRPLTG